ncbi:MAG: hypothetical protein K2O70_09680 [Desulfovibrionaceae bacterium]|nr:hypothetical protein [Desulfovibrionaceae bacterium]
MIYSAVSPNPKMPFHTIIGISDAVLDLTFARNADAATDEPQIIRHGGREVAVEILNNFKIHLEELRTAQDWKDACLWGIGIVPFSRVHIYNMLADSFAARRPLSKNIVFIPTMTTVKMVVPFTEAAFTDMDFFVERPDAASFVMAAAVTELEFPAFVERRNACLPYVVMEGPDTVARDGYAAFTATVFRDGAVLEHPMDVELENVNGYLPKTRVRVFGQGTFRVGAPGLEPGETIKIKAGFRFLGATSEKIVTVV